MILSVLLYSFIFFSATQILYYLFYSTILFKSKERKFKETLIPVSLILYTKNAKEYLEENIQAFLEQDYPKFELLVLNNASSDGTEEVLERLANEHPNIKIVTVKNNEAFWGSKKYALTLGIKAAKYNNLVFSDSKVKPISEHWLSNVCSEFSNEKQIIISHEIKNSKSKLLASFIRFDNITNALKSFSLANIGFAFQANSSNIAYSKDIFFKVNGFINHMKLHSGASDLFLKDASNKHNTTICLTSNSLVSLETDLSYKQWIKDLRARKNLAKNYKFENRLYLGFFKFSKIIFILLATISCFFITWKITIPIISSYFLIQFIVVGIASKRFKESFFILLIPLFDILLVLIQFSIFIADSLSNKKY